MESIIHQCEIDENIIRTFWNLWFNKLSLKAKRQTPLDTKCGLCPDSLWDGKGLYRVYFGVSRLDEAILKSSLVILHFEFVLGRNWPVPRLGPAPGPVGARAEPGPDA